MARAASPFLCAPLAPHTWLRYFGPTVSALYFISDVHLGTGSPAEEAPMEDRLLDLLGRVASDGERLYILGDLFDFWFEYSCAVPAVGLKVLAALQGLVENGVEVHYLAGNHDFALGSYITDTIGCIVHPDPIEVEYRGKRFFLHHGDGLAGRDTGYRILKKVVRNRLIQALWRWVHPDIGFWIAGRVSGTSRRYTRKKDYGTGESSDMHLDRFSREGYDYILMGHTHEADERIFENGCVYLNLGSWLDGGAPHARFEDDTLELVLPDGSLRRYGREGDRQ